MYIRGETIDSCHDGLLDQQLTTPTSHIQNRGEENNRFFFFFFLFFGTHPNATRCNVSHSTEERGYDSTELRGVNTIPVGSIGSVRVVPSCWPLGAWSSRARSPFIHLTRKTMCLSASDWYAILSTYCNTMLENIPRVFLHYASWIIICAHILVFLKCTRECTILLIYCIFLIFDWAKPYKCYFASTTKCYL